MADFGEALPELPRHRAPRAHAAAAEPAPASPSTRSGTPPSTSAASFRGRPGFGIDNAITQFDAAAPDRIVFNKGFACGPNDPAGWDSYCKGDKRAVFHPRWEVDNRGRSRFRTDAYGRRAPTGLLQVVSRRLRVDQSDECCGAENAFVMEQPSDGGIYRAGRGLGTRGTSSSRATACSRTN